MFHPGETIAHTFTLPYNKAEIHHVIVSYRQQEQIILEKIITSRTNLVEVGEKETITSVIMSEAESLLFKDLTDFAIQINVFTGYGNEVTGRATSNEIRGTTGIQHIRDLGDATATEGLGKLYIDNDGWLIHTRSNNRNRFSVDNDGFLVISREVVQDGE